MVSGVISIPCDGPLVLDESPSSRSCQLREFVVGPENTLLKAASDALSPGSRYNPLLLFGSTGVGKSHLLQLFTANYQVRHPSRTVLLLGGAEFARGFNAAVELDAVDEFRKKHRRVDLFALDDLQEIARRSAAQQELLHTIDTLVSHGRQVLLASRADLTELDCLLPGLVSRLGSGLTVPLLRPGPQARRVLLSRIAEQRNIPLTEQRVSQILDGNHESVSQMTAALLALEHSRNGSRGRSATHRPLPAHLTPREIARQVARYFQIKLSELTGSSRRQSTVRARGVAIYLIRSLTQTSFERLGRLFGGRDHSTTLHAYRRIEAALPSDSLIQQAVHEITRRLGVVDSGPE